jgi:hypothetical protein
VSKQEVVHVNDLLRDMEELREEMPIDAFLKESKEFKEMMEQLERAYAKRERVIGLIMKEGNGMESRRALRMFPTALLEKWVEALRTTRPKIHS